LLPRNGLSGILAPGIAVPLGALELPFDAKGRNLTMKAMALCLLVVGLLASGCATHYIQNTDVEDNDENRKIITFCEKYRHAVEERNVPLLLEMASSRYYEDGGNVDAADDMDYAGLREYLETRFKETRAIRYEIRYRRINHGAKDRVDVEYTYTASYKIPGLHGEEWRHTVAENRLELVPEQASYKILAGM
jgi:hypothetical protein